MRALELVRSAEQREPAKEETEQVLRHCRERGLILLSAGTYGNVIRVLVPLVVTTEQFDEGLNVWKPRWHRGRIASGNHSAPRVRLRSAREGERVCGSWLEPGHARRQPGAALSAEVPNSQLSFRLLSSRELESGDHLWEPQQKLR